MASCRSVGARASSSERSLVSREHLRRQRRAPRPRTRALAGRVQTRARGALPARSRGRRARLRHRGDSRHERRRGRTGRRSWCTSRATAPWRSRCGSPELGDDGRLDPLCQIIEGVSHFVYLTERAQAEQSTTHLELEIQAEVDKYVVLAASVRDLDARSSAQLRCTPVRRRGLRPRRGERDRRPLPPGQRRGPRLRRAPRTRAPGDAHPSERCGASCGRFFRAGQEEKLRAARG